MLDNRQLHAQIEMANLTDEFWKTELGQYCLGLVREQIMARATTDLTKVDPDDAKAVRRLQETIFKAGAVPGFFNELLAEGRQALEVIESTDDLEEDN